MCVSYQYGYRPGMEHHEHPLVYTTLILLLLCNPYVCFDIRVSQTAGRNSEACLEPNSTTQCKTIQYALQAINYSATEPDLRIIIMDHVYILSETIEIIQPSQSRRVSITSVNGIAIMRCRNESAGIDIGSKESSNSTSNVQFTNLLFHHCGPLRAAVVHIWNANNITFEYSKFINNTQAAINAFDSTVYIGSCVFVNNSFNAHADQPFEPGVASMSGAVGYLVTNSTDLSITIIDSVFRMNRAVRHNNDLYVSAAMNYTEYSEDGGAILIIFGSNASNCKATLDNVTLSKNSATYGGGLFIATGGHSTGIEFKLINSVIEGNTAWQAGGGLCIAQWDYSKKSKFLLKNSIIIRNKSRRGGGINGFFMSFLHTTQVQLEMVGLLVKANIAQSSAALRFTSSLPFGTPPDIHPVFTNCTISHHTSSFRDLYTYLAAITAQRINLVFTGWNLVAHNIGAGGMDIESGVLHVQGNLSFVNNSGDNGGALRLWSSQIRLYPYSNLNFYYNFASNAGGALSVELFPTYEVIHEYNVDCFLSYSESLQPPSKWKTNVTFIGNGAKLKAAAIYVSSLASCLWDEEFPHYNVNKSLRWISNRFIYQGNFLVTDSKPLSGPEYDIATDTAVLKSGQEQKKLIKLSPGETSEVNLQGLDELGHAVYTIAAMAELSPDSNSDHNSHCLSLDYPMHVLAPSNNNTLYVSYHTSDKHYPSLVNKTHNINVVGVYSSHNVNYEFQIQSVACWPGYKFDDNVCTCDKSISGIVRCDMKRRIVYLEEGIWGGVYNGSLVTYNCPFSYCHCNKSDDDDDDDSPGCRFDPEDINSQCEEGREGVLCGRCKSGLSVGLAWGECIKCSHGGWVLAVVFITVIIMCVLVIYLNPAMSRDLRGPLFFFQMLPFIFVPNDSVGRAVTLASYFVEFGGPLIYVWKTCIKAGMNNLYAVAMGYMMPVTTLLIFLVAYILSYKRIIRMRLRRKSNIQAFWVLMLFMYKYIVETTMRLLHCPFVDNKMVFFYDGNMECFHGKHLVIGIIALLVLVGMVIPPPIIIVALTRGYWKVDPQYVSTLTDGLQPHCLWWWAVDLARRVLIVGIYVFIPRWRTKQIWMIIASVVVFGVHSNVQPYKGLRANLVESLYLLGLCVLTVVQIINDDDLRSNISAALLLIATIHSSLLLIYKSWRFFRKRCKCKCRILSKGRTYGALEDSGDITQEKLDAEVKARKALFDSVYASSDVE